MSLVRRARQVAARSIVVLGLLFIFGPLAADGAGQSARGGIATLRLATTTSTEDSGLLQAILPAFEKACGCRVSVIAVGTGQALEIARRGDADVVLVHAREDEDRFVAEHHARQRFDVMYNDFVIVGPRADPARISGTTGARDAFAAISKSAVLFASRGDKSGTNSAELAIWAALAIAPSGAPWYRSLGQGMGETLLFANDQRGYALSDRATYLAMRDRLPGLRILVGGARLADNTDKTLRNQYGVMAVNPDVHPGVNVALATRFVDWLVSKPTQRVIGAFGVARFGQSLFYPDSDEFRATGSVAVTSDRTIVTLTLADLRALPRVTLRDYPVVGVKRGPAGRYTLTGAALSDVLLKADPSLGDTRHVGDRFFIESSDGWTVTMSWAELFGTVPRGFAAYNAKGCNECHGVAGEGTSPSGKRPAPRLADRDLPLQRTLSLLRAGGTSHAGLNPYTEAQLGTATLQAMLSWLKNPATGAAAGIEAPPAVRQPTVLAYERDGNPMGGRDGLIQLVVGNDEYAGRYSHWVSAIRVVTAPR